MVVFRIDPNTAYDENSSLPKHCDENQLLGFKNTPQSDIKCYITAELEASEIGSAGYELSIGDDFSYGGYNNMNLDAGKDYAILVGVVVTLDVSASSDSHLQNAYSNKKQLHFFLTIIFYMQRYPHSCISEHNFFVAGHHDIL